MINSSVRHFFSTSKRKLTVEEFLAGLVHALLVVEAFAGKRQAIDPSIITATQVNCYLFCINNSIHMDRTAS